MVILQAEIIVLRLSADRSDLLGLVVSPLLLLLFASSLWSWWQPGAAAAVTGSGNLAKAHP